MRQLNLYLLISTVIFLFSGKIVYSQNTTDCKVLITELSGDYKGDCKKGLANGMGEAKGTDRYVGSFKKGYPHGKGVYYYSSGAVYEGSFINGKRQGQGKLSFTVDGELITEDGIWEQDNYKGKKPEPPYEITLKQNISRYSFLKTKDPRDMIMIKVTRNGTVIYPENLSLGGNSGTVIQQRSFTGFEQIQFPFSGSIKYTLLTPYNLSSIDYELNFIIREAGSWEITLSH